MHLPSPTELGYFVEVAQTLNVSRAAERLGVSQPTLSLAIRRLEDGFGTPLLIRTKSGVQLTHTGQRLLDQARGLLNEWEKIRSDTLKDESEICGRYVIGCHPSVALYSLPSFLSDLLENYPSLEIKLMHDLSRKITEDVISFKVDFGIVVNPWNHPDLVIRPLCEDEVSMWVRNPLSKLQCVEGGKAVLILDPELLQAQSIVKQFEKYNLSFRRQITSSNLEVIAAMVAAGVGVGILPGRVATRVRSYKLQPLKESPAYKDRICPVYRVDAQKTKASRRLAQIIEQTVGRSVFLYVRVIWLSLSPSELCQTARASMLARTPFRRP